MSLEALMSEIRRKPQVAVGRTRHTCPTRLLLGSVSADRAFQVTQTQTPPEQGLKSENIHSQSHPAQQKVALPFDLHILCSSFRDTTGGG